MSIKDEVAVVTGGTRGLGKAIAMKLANAGGKVVIMGTNQERGEQVLQELTAIVGEGNSAFYQVDVSNQESVDEAIKSIIEKFGKVDILVNNAGITQDQLLIKMTEKNWDDVMAINVKSCYNLCHALVRSMMKARKGKIINISSVVGLTGNPGQVNYAASKGAMIAFTKALAKELAVRNICVNCVAPGFIQSDMTEALNETQKEAILRQIPMGRMGDANNVADAVLFLAGPSSDYITGHVLTVDGGMTTY